MPSDLNHQPTNLLSSIPPPPSPQFAQWLTGQEALFQATYPKMTSEGKSLQEIIDNNVENPDIVNAIQSRIEDFQALETFSIYLRSDILSQTLWSDALFLMEIVCYYISPNSLFHS